MEAVVVHAGGSSRCRGRAAFPPSRAAALAAILFYLSAAAPAGRRERRRSIVNVLPPLFSLFFFFFPYHRSNKIQNHWPHTVLQGSGHFRLFQVLHLHGLNPSLVSSNMDSTDPQKAKMLKKIAGESVRNFSFLSFTPFLGFKQVWSAWSLFSNSFLSSTEKLHPRSLREESELGAPETGDIYAPVLLYVWALCALQNWQMFRLSSAK